MSIVSSMLGSDFTRTLPKPGPESKVKIPESPDQRGPKLPGIVGRMLSKSAPDNYGALER